jgi:phosphotransferase system HPr (HPr) family protein
MTDTYLGISIPKVVIPVKPGRNVPVIIETAARNERLKKLGFYSAKEFDQNVLKWLESETARRTYYIDEENCVMVERELTILNRAGIHARPAASIVKVANGYKSELTFIKDTMEVNGKSIMGIITLGAPYQTKVLMRTEGPDEVELADAIQHLFENRFEE